MKIKEKKRSVKVRSRKQSRETYDIYAQKDALISDMNCDRVQQAYSRFYAGIDPRRKKEMAEGGMIQEDRQAMSNLPQQGFQRHYPRAGYYTNPYIQDSELTDKD